jgi:hypothetical protein
MLTALILICSVTLTPDLQNCSRKNARTVMRAPAQFENPATCFLHAQAYLAGTSIGQQLSSNDRVKVVCGRSTATDASVPVLTFR